MKFLLLCALSAVITAATPDVKTTKRAVETARSVYRALSGSGLSEQEMSVALVDGFLKEFWWQNRSEDTYRDLISGNLNLDINSDLADGRTIFHALALEGEQSDVEMLHLFMLHEETDLTAQENIKQDTPIELAARSKNLVMLSNMLPARKYSEPEYKKLLQLALTRRSVEMVEALVSYGYRDQDTQLSASLNRFLGEPWKTKINLAEIFIRYGGDPNYENPVEKLVEQYAGVPYAHWEGGRWFTPKAWQEGKPLRQPIYNQVKTLLEAGADLNLMPDILKNIMDRQMTLLLLEHGADHDSYKLYRNIAVGSSKSWSILVRDGVMTFSEDDSGAIFEAYLEAQKQEAIMEFRAQAK